MGEAGGGLCVSGRKGNSRENKERKIAYEVDVGSGRSGVCQGFIDNKEDREESDKV